MVNRCALVDTDGVVVNVALVDSDADWSPDDGITVVPLTDEAVSPGWTYDGAAFHVPSAPAVSEPPVPVTVAPTVVGELIAQAATASTVTKVRQVLIDTLNALNPQG
jgi:hypothetical protein